MKKIFSLVVVIVVIGGFFIWLYGLVFNQIEEDVQIPPQPEYSERPTTMEKKITVLSKDGAMQIADITIDPIASYEGEVVVFAKNDNFSIIYYGLNNQFLISLLQKNNFTFARTYAEQTFLKKLQITQKQACSLSVDVVIPPYVDFNLEGSYGLSFCPGAVALP